MNLAIIALLPRLFNLCDISMSSGLTGTSRASAILRIASSGKGPEMFANITKVTRIFLAN